MKANPNALGEEAPTAPSVKPVFSLADWPSLRAFFSAYDLTPWRIVEYRQPLSGDREIQLLVVHFPKIFLLVRSGSAIRDDLTSRRRTLEFGTVVFRHEMAQVRFDLLKRRRTINDAGWMAYYEAVEEQ